MQIEFIGILGVLAWIIGFGYISATTAARLDRSALVWLLLGAILGPVAVILLRAAPPGRCQTCMAPTRGWRTECWWCHENVFTRRLVAPVRLTAPSAEDEPDTSSTIRHGSSTGMTHWGAVNIAPWPLRERTEVLSGVEPPTVAGLNPRSDVAAMLRETPGTPVLPSSELPDYLVQRSSNREPVIPVAEPPRKRAAPDQPISAAEEPVQASAVYVTGTLSLEPGQRYELSIEGPRLLVRGPLGIDPAAVVLDRPLAETGASAISGRLVINDRKRGTDLVLAFMALNGMSPETLANAITAAAQGSTAS